MDKISKLLESMRNNPKAIRFEDLKSVCIHFFGLPRQNGTSHLTFSTPWPGDPRVVIQNDHGKAKAYQVRQVLKAVDRLKEIEGEQ